MTPASARSPVHRHRPLSEINVTPLVDVMLVLLVVFMVTAPMLAAGLKVDLPTTAAARPLPPSEPIVVTVTRDGGVAVGTETVGRDALTATIRARIGEATDRAIHVRGDREVAYGEVIAVIDRLAADGLGRIALVSQTRTAPPAPSGPAALATAEAAGGVVR